MNEIKPTYVSFEQAKLLFEKCNLKREDLGFKHGSVSKPYYTEKGEFNGDCLEHIKNILNKTPSILYAAPEQWQVIEWLRVNHGLFIIAVPNETRKGKWHYHRFDLLETGRDSEPELVDKFNTPQEATSAAIDYVLKELI
jgi:hypothetical protein